MECSTNKAGPAPGAWRPQLGCRQQSCSKLVLTMQKTAAPAAAALKLKLRALPRRVVRRSRLASRANAADIAPCGVFRSRQCCRERALSEEQCRELLELGVVQGILTPTFIVYRPHKVKQRAQGRIWNVVVVVFALVLLVLNFSTSNH